LCNYKYIDILIIIHLSILENETPTVQSPQEHIETPTDDENMETAYSIKNIVPKIETKKKRVCKGKKKYVNSYFLYYIFNMCIYTYKLISRNISSRININS